MITVHYKPFDNLRPVHLAVMAAAEAGLPSGELPVVFGLPDLVLQHARDDLAAWGFVSFHIGEICVLPAGSRCVSVWVATEQRGFWNFPNHDGWRLGKGVFFFKSPLSRLCDAGLDPETGLVLSHKEATARQRAFVSEIEALELEIQNGTASRILTSCFESDGDPSDPIAAWLGRARSRLHLNQLCRMMNAAAEGGGLDDPSAHRRVTLARRCIEEQRKLAERRLRDEQREMQPVQEVLMANWLSERSGLLRDLAEADPCSILIRSDSNAVARVRSPETKVPESEVACDQSGRVMNGLRNLFRSFFK